MSKLSTIIEQTSFLIEYQEQTRESSAHTFKEALGFIEQKINEYKKDGSESEDCKSLENIADMLSSRAQEMQTITDQDLEFLKAQLDAFSEVEKLDNAEQQEEIIAAMFEDDEDLLETDAFKKEVVQEAEEGKKYLAAMVDDIRNSVDEGDIKGVELLLEAAIEESRKLEKAQEEEAEKNAGGCCSDGGCPPEGCGSCSLAAGGEEGEDFDLMSIIDQYSKDLEADLAKKDTKNEADKQD